MSGPKQALILVAFIISVVLILMSVISEFDAFDWLDAEWSVRGLFYLTLGVVILCVDLAVLAYLRRHSP
jgi:Co/Zn/Cd efflux system component